jgi:hypothetical protein
VLIIHFHFTTVESTTEMRENETVLNPYYLLGDGVVLLATLALPLIDVARRHCNYKLSNSNSCLIVFEPYRI